MKKTTTGAAALALLVLGAATAAAAGKPPPPPTKEKPAGPRRKKGDAFEEAAAEHGLVITSYALLNRDAAFLRAAGREQGQDQESKQVVKGAHVISVTNQRPQRA